MLAWTDFKLRYQGSVLGYLWTLVKPLMLFGVLYIVFSTLMRSPVEHYQIYLLLGIILWNFFVEGTQFGLTSLLNKANLISKIYFPRILIIIASSVSAFITFALNFLVFVFFLIINHIPFVWSMLFFPVYLIELYLIVLGVSLVLSVLYVRFRDLNHIWEIILQIGFYFTPIFYTLSIVPEQYHRFLFLNPVMRVIHYSRAVFLDGQIPSLWYNSVLFVISIGIFLVGLLVFRKYNKNLIEHI